ncbi:Uncharacterised protein [Actinomyces bovis]|uniref:Uncharacterized protein n=1 Tax=Actinomyces bovis TaxID=1658 RepID=A0ABY1VTT6_9ACTO|nr:hypothetical protein [Actinomyces bovis]SPT54448.1 Uncharacterised protein [Actinomyces bovis]VEG55942.1 Uncharacterised protein [Actinomyces israelii]
MTQYEAGLMVEDISVAKFLLPTTLPETWTGSAATACANALTQASKLLDQVTLSGGQASNSCLALDQVI